jgi:hypothetical protein
LLTANNINVPAEGGKPVLEASVALMPRSLLVFRDQAYTSCMHGIDAVGVHSAHFIQLICQEAEASALFVRRAVFDHYKAFASTLVELEQYMAAGARGFA